MKTLRTAIPLITGIISFMAFAFKPSVSGKELYEKNCQRCHGVDGAKGLFGARNLQKTFLTDSAIVLQMRKGSGFMPSFKKNYHKQK